MIAELFQLRTRDDFISIGQKPCPQPLKGGMTRYETGVHASWVPTVASGWVEDRFQNPKPSLTSIARNLDFIIRTFSNVG